MAWQANLGLIFLCIRTSLSFVKLFSIIIDLIQLINESKFYTVKRAKYKIVLDAGAIDLDVLLTLV